MQFPRWLPYDAVKKLFDILSKKGECRLVGGCVRNILINTGKTDIDIATTIGPMDVVKLLKDNGINCIPTGLKYGTITAIINGEHFELTTLRKDVETFGRDVNVEFTNVWEEDANRRDFTINALYMDLAGKVYDYFGGAADLEQRLLRFVGVPKERIQEDYLRILRYFRFIGYFGVEKIDQESLDAIMQNGRNIVKLSSERIQNELFKILATKYVKDALLLMEQAHILHYLGIDIDARACGALLYTNDNLVNLAALLRAAQYEEESFAAFGRFLKLSNAHRSTLKKLLFETPQIIELDLVKPLLYKFGKLLLAKMCKLHQVEGRRIAEGILEEIMLQEMPIFPIKGEDLLALGYKGERLGAKLKEMEQLWIASKFSISKESLLENM